MARTVAEFHRMIDQKLAYWRGGFMEGAEPRVHGNGFLQLDLSPVERMHIWDNSLPHQEGDSSIHNHSFGFTSTILLGTLVNTILEPTFEAKRGAFEYELYRTWPTKGANTDLMPTGVRCNFRVVSTNMYNAGDTYEMPVGLFHLSLPLGRTLTVIEKHPRMDAAPIVAARIGVTPDNSYDRHGFEAGPLWALIDDTLGRLKFSMNANLGQPA